jgi:hypothetical protein
MWHDDTGIKRALVVLLPAAIERQRNYRPRVKANICLERTATA